MNDPPLQAYASLGGQDAGKRKWETLGGPLLQHETVAAMAGRHGATPAQVLLRWALQQGVAVIPKSVSESRMEENAAVMSSDFALTEEDMTTLTNMDQVSDSVQ